MAMFPWPRNHLCNRQRTRQKKTNFNQFLKKTGGDDSDSEEDSKTVIRSARDKRYEEMRTRVSAIQNAVAINDWVSIQAEFDKLQKQLLKFDVTIKREGIPRFYIRTLTGLQEAIEGPTTKKMNPSTSKAYNAMKQKIKKVFKIHEEAFEKFSQSPVDELDSADEAEELALKAEEELAAAKTKAVKFVIEEEDDDGFVMVGKKVQSFLNIGKSQSRRESWQHYIIRKAGGNNRSTWKEKYRQVCTSRGAFHAGQAIIHTLSTNQMYHGVDFCSI